MLPWFDNKFPLYLAPMAGVTDTVFRGICKRFGADVVVTEFVSAEGIMHRNKRTREYLEFCEPERPLGVQLFGADGERMGEAARQVIDWVQPDFIDLNFGCPVNKVVSKNGGSALLKDCPLLAKVATGVVNAVGDFPVTAKIRTGWSQTTVNAVETARLLEDCGIRAIAVHGRTRADGYSGEANWDTIGDVVDAVSIPVIGNGDLTGARDVVKRRTDTGVAGVMIGRAAMSAPWIFDQIKHELATGTALPEPSPEAKWQTIRDHCEMAIARRGDENTAMRFMRGRLMAYSKTLPAAKKLRVQFSQLTSLEALDAIIDHHLTTLAATPPAIPDPS